MALYFDIMKKDHVGLAWSFSVNPQKCDNPEIFRLQLVGAISDMEAGNSVTHIFIDDSNGKKAIAGFVTLRASAYLTLYPGDENFNAHPAIEIQYLAVDERFEGQGIGTLLVKQAIVLADELRQKYIGVQYIVLRSNRKSLSFYKRKTFGFKELSKVGKLAADNWNKDCEPLIVRLPKA